jgi:SAM-dependent methyltransferase
VRHHANEFVDAPAALAFEDSAWWYVGRGAIVRRLLERARSTSTLARIVEIGSGSGPHLSLLAEYGAVTAVEPSAMLAERCRSRGVAARVVCGDVTALDPADTFELACLFDVLEHMEDDVAFLRRLRGHLTADGLLMLSVPANPWLYGPHDALLHHFRRYSRRGLDRLLAAADYRVLRSSYFLTALFPPAAIARSADKVRAWLGRPPKQVNLGAVPPRLNYVLARLLAAEAALADRYRLPFGLWLVYLAQRA